MAESGICLLSGRQKLEVETPATAQAQGLAKEVLTTSTALCSILGLVVSTTSMVAFCQDCRGDVGRSPVRDDVGAARNSFCRRMVLLAVLAWLGEVGGRR